MTKLNRKKRRKSKRPSVRLSYAATMHYLKSEVAVRNMAARERRSLLAELKAMQKRLLGECCTVVWFDDIWEYPVKHSDWISCPGYVPEYPPPLVPVEKVAEQAVRLHQVHYHKAWFLRFCDLPVGDYDNEKVAEEMRNAFTRRLVAILAADRSSRGNHIPDAGQMVWTPASTPPTVFVVVSGERHQGGSVESVHATREAAIDAAMKVKCHFPGGWTQGDGDKDVWTNGCDYVCVGEFPILPTPLPPLEKEKA